MLVDQNFSGNSGQPPTTSSSQSTPKPEPVRFTITGQRQAILRTVQLLHHQGIILGSEWSSAIPIKNSSEVIRVAVRII
ncbi:MAG: hypothetical protein ACFBSC_21700 [Microcoleaceae cyanobacterium]